MAETQTILITGATGKQGGALAHALAGTGFRLRAMTRKPDSPAAVALEQALAGAWGVFGVQNTWEAGVEGEEAQGKRLAELARKAGVQHYVYSSVGSADRQTGIPHFENKWRIEETVRALSFPSHVILRPVFFMENLTTPWFLNGDKIYAGMDPATVLQMIAVEDIGRYAARAFTDAARLNRREIDLAGDAVTIPQAADILGQAIGKRIEFVRVPIDEVRKNSADFAAMLEWFDRVGYDVDIPALEAEFGIKAVKLKDWAAKNVKG